MPQINVKDVPEELDEALRAAARGLAVSKSAVILRALELFVHNYKEFVDKGRELMKSSPLRKG